MTAGWKGLVLQCDGMIQRVLKVVRIAQVGMVVHGEKQKLANHIGRMANVANIALDVKDGAMAVAKDEVTREDFRTGVRLVKRFTPTAMRKLSEVQRNRRIARAARLKAET